MLMVPSALENDEFQRVLHISSEEKLGILSPAHITVTATGSSSWQRTEENQIRALKELENEKHKRRNFWLKMDHKSGRVSRSTCITTILVVKTRLLSVEVG